MKFKNFIIFTLTFLIIGCDGSYQSNDDEMLYEIDPFLKSGGFIAVGELGTILTSSDGTSWDNRSSGTTSSLIGVTYGNSKFLTMTGSMDDGTNNTATVLTSSNGTSWTSSSATCSNCDNNTISVTNVTYAE